MSVNDITYVIIIMVGGYISKHGNKPKIMSFTAVIGVVGNICMFLPYFIFPKNDQLGAVSSANKSVSLFMICSAGKTNETTCSRENIAPSGVAYAYYILLIGQLLNGIGGSCIYSLAVAFLEQHSAKAKASFYIGNKLKQFHH